MSKRPLILTKNSTIRASQMTNSYKNLSPKLSDVSDISKPWDRDNQAWWDWYVSLANNDVKKDEIINADPCLLYTSPSPRDATLSRMPSSA